jgi:hypothetical protein
MKNLTHKQLIDKLAKRKGAVILGIVAETPLKVRQAGNPFQVVTRLVHKTVVTGANYAKAVVKQGGKDFKSEGLPYGEFLVKDKVVKASSGPQLRTVARNPRKPIRDFYLADGKPIPNAIVAPFLYQKGGSAKQEKAGVKGKKQVQVRNYSFSNIREIHLDGEVYNLVK